jgi:hypothetical protein
MQFPKFRLVIYSILLPNEWSSSSDITVLDTSPVLFNAYWKCFPKVIHRNCQGIVF